MSSGLEAWNGMGAFGELQAKREREIHFLRIDNICMCACGTHSTVKRKHLSPHPPSGGTPVAICLFILPEIDQSCASICSYVYTHICNFDFFFNYIFFCIGQTLNFSMYKMVFFEASPLTSQPPTSRP